MKEGEDDDEGDGVRVGSGEGGRRKKGRGEYKRNSSHGEPCVLHLTHIYCPLPLLISLI